MLPGLLLAVEMCEQIAAIHAARAEHLEGVERPAGDDVEEIPVLHSPAEMARARASVAAGLAVAIRLRAEQEDTPAAREPWWRRLYR
jgi:hypothetical protein